MKQDFADRFAFLVSGLLVILRHQIAYLFTSDPVVVAGVAKLTIYVALFQTADGIVGVGGGTMRVLGLVRKGAILNLIAYYIIVSPAFFSPADQ